MYANIFGHRVHFGPAKGARGARVPFSRIIPPCGENPP